MGSGVSTTSKQIVEKKVETKFDEKAVSSVESQNNFVNLLDNKESQSANVMGCDEKNNFTTSTQNQHNHQRQTENYQGEIGDEELQEDNVESAIFFSHTALSLGMDNDDLLFNLMFFDDGNAPTIGSMMNSVQQETLALHSSNNTPYKLRPASENAIAKLKTELFDDRCADLDVERECAVCKDEMENGCSIVRLPACCHYFHEDCLLRWINLQGWCPVCRADILEVSSSPNECIHVDYGGDDCSRTAALSVQGDEAEDSHSRAIVSTKLFADDETTQSATEIINTRELTLRSTCSARRDHTGIVSSE